MIEQANTRIRVGAHKRRRGSGRHLIIIGELEAHNLEERGVMCAA